MPSRRGAPWPWPRATTVARAAFLCKDPEKAQDPMQYRVLRIVSALYRRWAAIRLETLRPWIGKWANKSIGAGADPYGATDSAYEVAIDFELARLEGEHTCGGTVDIAKFFDQIVREVVYTVCRIMGMPARVLETYIMFQETVVTRNVVATGLGTP